MQRGSDPYDQVTQWGICHFICSLRAGFLQNSGNHVTPQGQSPFTYTMRLNDTTHFKSLGVEIKCIRIGNRDQVTGRHGIIETEIFNLASFFTTSTISSWTFINKYGGGPSWVQILSLREAGSQPQDG